jgi:hypothetical protein
MFFKFNLFFTVCEGRAVTNFFYSVVYEDALIFIGLKLRRYLVTARRGFIILILAIGRLCSVPILC